MDPKIKFLFYAAAVVCFVLAAVQGSGRGGVASRGAMARVSLVPIGLALFVFPFMWDTGAEAF